MPSETSVSTIVRPEHLHTDEADGNDLKNNFMKMIEALKEEIKNSLEELEEKTNKKLEEINKSLKKTKKKRSNRGRK